MSLAFNRSLNPKTGRPLNPGTGRPGAPAVATKDARLNITVVFTSVDATLHTLARAGVLAESLAGRITLIVPQIVPFPLPLTSPPVLLQFQEKRFREIAAQSPVDIRVELYLCRDQREALTQALKPKSLILLGGRSRWWPTAETRMARQLRRQGHEVIFSDV